MLDEFHAPNLKKINLSKFFERNTNSSLKSRTLVISLKPKITWSRKFHVLHRFGHMVLLSLSDIDQ